MVQKLKSRDAHMQTINILTMNYNLNNADTFVWEAQTVKVLSNSSIFCKIRAPEDKVHVFQHGSRLKKVVWTVLYLFGLAAVYHR